MWDECSIINRYEARCTERARAFNSRKLCFLEKSYLIKDLFLLILLSIFMQNSCLLLIYIDFIGYVIKVTNNQLLEKLKR